MVLDRVYKRITTLRRLRRSVLWTALDGFGQWLLDQGRTMESVRIHLWYVRFLTEHLRRRGVTGPAAVTWEYVEAFLDEHLDKHGSSQRGLVRHRGVKRAVRRFTEYLVFTGILPSPTQPPPTAYQALLEEHLTWLKDYCHRSSSTLVQRRRYLVPFLEWMGHDRLKTGKLEELCPELLQNFMLDHVCGGGSGRAVAVATALRGFCRFCFRRGYVDRDLVPAIPSFVRHRLSKVPRGISKEDARKVLSNIDRTTPMGRRDYAILQLLYTYGVRAQQICLLRLDDIQWSAGEIRFHPLKGGKNIVVPITDEVGEGLYDYLQGGRTPSSLPEVFLTVRPPGRLMCSTFVSVLVGRRLQNAGVRLSPKGAGVFRHGFASRMLGAGHSLKSIADMLGHRDIQTTAIYAKVDFRMLTSVALKWPEEQP